jgi:2-dehydro-3-deoxy-D-gluconate 5-dehydrogenase
VGLASKETLSAPIRTEIVDVTDTDAVDTLISGVSELNIVVNAAGVIRRDEESDLGVFAQVLDVNLVGAMRVCLAAHPKLMASGGSIVNIASMLSFFGGGRIPAYSASKGWIVQLTRSLAIAWAPDHIRVNESRPAGSLRGSLNHFRTILSVRQRSSPVRQWGAGGVPRKSPVPYYFCLRPLRPLSRER